MTDHDGTHGMPSGPEIMRQFVPNSPFAAFLGIELTEISPGRAVLRLPRKPELVTIGTTIHGGAISSLMDTAAMAAAWSRGAPEKLRGATASLSVVFLSAATDGDLVAEADLLKAGSSLCFVDVSVWSDPGRSAVARATATYKIG